MPMVHYCAHEVLPIDQNKTQILTLQFVDAKVRPATEQVTWPNRKVNLLQMRFD
jgi:hypothetical protein